jgi:diadenosine tetraphosphate (Ap4A) HIT family hydrolase
MECNSCRAMASEIVLTNAPRLTLDDYWSVEHGHPVAVAGWLVLVLRRHARALHELTEDEAVALGKWLPKLTRALHEATGCELEYVMQFAEGEGFHHVHFHIVARHGDWPDELKGPKAFAAWGLEDPVSADQATTVIEDVATFLRLDE